MTLKEEIAQGEDVALEFKEARPNDSLKYLKTVVAFAYGRCLAHGVISTDRRSLREAKSIEW